MPHLRVPQSDAARGPGVAGVSEEQERLPLSAAVADPDERTEKMETPVSAERNGFGICGRARPPAQQKNQQRATSECSQAGENQATDHAQFAAHFRFPAPDGWHLGP